MAVDFAINIEWTEMYLCGSQLGSIASPLYSVKPYMSHQSSQPRIIESIIGQILDK